jgi:hypothetical protein
MFFFRLKQIDRIKGLRRRRSQAIYQTALIVVIGGQTVVGI